MGEGGGDFRFLATRTTEKNNAETDAAQSQTTHFYRMPRYPARQDQLGASQEQLENRAARRSFASEGGSRSSASPPMTTTFGSMTGCHRTSRPPTELGMHALSHPDCIPDNFEAVGLRQPILVHKNFSLQPGCFAKTFLVTTRMSRRP